MSFRSLPRGLRGSIGSLSRRGFEVRLTGHHRGKSHGAVHELHDQLVVIQRSCWAGLPPELLRDMIKRLEESESTWPGRRHVVACAAVCRSWRQMCLEIVQSPELCGKLTFPVSLKQPGPRDGTVQCFIKRDKLNLNYHLFLCLSPALLVENGKFLPSAKRNRKTTCTEFVISMDADKISRSSCSYIGKLRSNFLGTKFILYDTQPPYNCSNIPAPGNTSRRFNSKSISFSKSVGSSTEFGSARFSDTVISSHEDEDATKERPLVMKNKPPRWHEQLQCWCLNFRGRVTVASVKNFQLINASHPAAGAPTPSQTTQSDHDKVILQFGKVGKDMFTMDYRYPLSVFQAFAICLSSFDTKLACE